MKIRLSAAIGLSCVLALVAWCSGCANAGNAPEMSVETRATGPAYVAWSDARPDKDGLVVSGVVRRSDLVGSPIKVTVSVEVVSASGAILDRAQADTVSVPHRRTDRVQGFERFSVRLPHLPPEGSSLRIVALNG
jgi:hypothetical protein